MAEILSKRGYDVIEYRADEVANGKADLDVHVSNTSGFHFTYEGRSIALEDISSAWYRRPTFFTEEQDDKARQLSLDLERNAIQHAFWNIIPEEAWLSSPRNIQNAERKITQLILAQELGFTIPETLLTTSWESVNDTLPSPIIFKPSYGMFYDKSGLKILYVSPISNDPNTLPVSSNPFPGFWQPYIRKNREWRITIVGDHSFDAAIYTDDSAKDDWRRHQLNSQRVVFKSEVFPDSTKKKCFQYLGKLGLKFGAFDFIEDESGEIIFLECNANGQFGWLEDELGFPISQAIADELSKITQR